MLQKTRNARQDDRNKEREIKMEERRNRQQESLMRRQGQSSRDLHMNRQKKRDGVGAVGCRLESKRGGLQCDVNHEERIGALMKLQSNSRW